MSFKIIQQVSEGKNLDGNASVYVVWTFLHEIETSTSNFKRSADNGTSFGSTKNLSTNPGNSTAAQIAVHQDNVCAVGEDATTGNGDIFFTRA